MSSFLQNVAAYIYNNYSEELGDSAVVFPGRRTAVFFKKFLTSITDKTIWAPEFLTVSDFFKQQSNLLIADELKLLFELFNAFIEETGSNETFDQFYYWGGMLLGDFDDTDKYLVNALQLYSNIESLKEIDEKFSSLTAEEIEIIKQFWTNVNPENKTFHKQEFIKIWKVLGNVYTNYKNKLLNQNYGYEGMVFRELAEKIENYTHKDIPWKKVFFVGLNALTPSEFKVMKVLQRMNIAEFFWDYDNLYVTDKLNEAGFFMRENLKNFPSPDYNNPIDNISGIQKNVKVISVASNVGQVKILKQELKLSQGKNNEIDSCIVLGDENLLIPVLHSIPLDIEKVNVTMGYPLNGSTVFHFIRILIDLFQSAKRSGHGYVFYYKHILAILNHQYLSSWKNDVHEIIEMITEKNKVYISSDLLKVNPFFKILFQFNNNKVNFSEHIMHILFLIVQNMSPNLKSKTRNENDTLSNQNYIQPALFKDIHNTISKESGNRYFDIEKEFIFHAYVLLKRFNELFTDLGIKVEMPTYYKMIKRVLQAGKVDFIGEPLAGLQVMGALETRGIDFKNLIILSMNEGQFPRKSTAMTFIPYNLRKAFGLPTYEHQDAIFAYYFYRLLQRADNISLIYNSNNEGLNGGEMSRYIYQLMYTSKLNIKFENTEYHIKGRIPHTIKITRDFLVSNVLQKYTEGSGENSLSPSAVNYFKNCSLKFYFRYILGLKEPQEVSEEIDNALFGNILHFSLKEIYKDLVNSEVSSQMLDVVLKNEKNIDRAIDQAFAISYYNDENMKTVPYTGKNIIIREVIKKYLMQMIRKDMEKTPFTIVSLEEKYQMQIPLYNGQFVVNMAGTIDRVDDIKGKIHIIDYKTGALHKRFKSVEDVFFPEKKGENDAISQIFLYSLMYLKSKNIHANNVLPFLIYLKEVYKDEFSPYILQNIEKRKNIKVESFEPYVSETEKYLVKLLEELFDENVTFIQTDDTDYCKSCAYREICHR